MLAPKAYSQGLLPRPQRKRRAGRMSPVEQIAQALELEIELVQQEAERDS